MMTYEEYKEQERLLDEATEFWYGLMELGPNEFPEKDAKSYLKRGMRGANEHVKELMLNARMFDGDIIKAYEDFEMDDPFDMVSIIYGVTDYGTPMKDIARFILSLQLEAPVEANDDEEESFYANLRSEMQDDCDPALWYAVSIAVENALHRTPKPIRHWFNRFSIENLENHQVAEVVDRGASNAFMKFSKRVLERDYGRKYTFISVPNEKSADFKVTGDGNIYYFSWYRLGG